MSDNETTEMWRDYRAEQQRRRAQALPARQREIWALTGRGFDVRKVTPWQFRVDRRLDLYPANRRWHDTKTGDRGSYQTAEAIAMKRLRRKKETV